MADMKRSGRKSGLKSSEKAKSESVGGAPPANPDGLEPHEAAQDQPRVNYKVVGFAPPSTVVAGGMGVGNAGTPIRRSVVVGSVQNARGGGPKAPEPVSPIWPGPPPIPARKPV